eukprot:Blabericola_migrator_1__2876@NODE_1825_length_3732_cov_152_160709_g1171_i0_p1_GENE_NODE_1825_length_3732_cov_152_160709_g1171_i0NODE_1825_length_3732_cov_152_160709_g1171_i0_p1_ORF_typecomplete_len1127_score237_19_NODE_1825_length_3732_cov_152_160709_g1171_i01943574
MPSYNLTVSPSSTVGGKAVFMGLLCTLQAQGLSIMDNESAAALCDQTTPRKKTTRQRLPYITDEAALDEILDKEPGTIYVVKKTSEEEASSVRAMAIQSDPIIAEGIKALEAHNMDYVIELIPKNDLIKGRGDGALDLWDISGIDTSSPLYRVALKNQASLNEIEAIHVDQAAALKHILTTVGNLVRIAPNSPAKNEAAQFRYFLNEISEVLSSLKKTNAPKTLLPGAVSAVFAKYKDQCWDGLMKLAGGEAAKELQACADVLLDPQHVSNYFKFVETAQLTPPGPSCEEFDVAFGLLSEVDTETTSLYRDLIVYLHDTVKPQVDSLDKAHALQVNAGMKREELESQISQLNICIRNYIQCFYNIAQDFAQIERMSVPDKKARLQACMYSRIAGVSRKFWPALEGCLEELCDATVVKDIRSKEEALRKQLVARPLQSGQLASDEQSASVEDTSSESAWSRMSSYITNLLSSKNGVKEGDMTNKHDQESMSPMFSDLLEIVDQLKTYGQIASSSPEESPDVPDTIVPGDRVAICGALGFVSKPKAAALFSYLKRLQKCLEFIEYEGIGKEEELASIKKFLNVDYHIMKAIQDEGHPLGVHGNMDTEECDKIMTSTFDKYFKECWPHISGVLEGGGQEESIEGLEGMATDIANWRDPGQELDPKSSQVIQNIKKLADIRVLWYVAGMLKFLQGASSEGRWYNMTQDLFSNGLCPSLSGGSHRVWHSHSPSSPWMVCLPPITAKNKVKALDLVAKQSLGSFDQFDSIRQKCLEQKNTLSSANITYDDDFLHYDLKGNPHWEWRSQLKSMGQINATDLMGYAQEHGLDISCNRAFAARWYDATDQVIKKLCNEALHRTLEVRPIHPKPWPEDPGRLSLIKYKFNLVTGFPGDRFKKTKSKRNYQGFVVCGNGTALSDKKVMSKFKKPKSYKAARMAQRLCKAKEFKNRSRDVSIFYSTVTIEPNGKIFISNQDHKGRLGSCWPALDKELEAVRKGHRLRKTREVSNVTLGGQARSEEEIVEAFAEAEKEGLIQVNEYYGDFADQWNDTLNWTATQAALQLDGASLGVGKPIEGCSSELCATSEALLSYWPYVLGAVGTIGTLFTAKKVWEGRKAHSGRDYRQVTKETSTV